MTTNATHVVSLPVYCDHCDATHIFTTAEIEKLVYALVGMEHDSALNPEPSTPPRQENEFECLKVIFGWCAQGDIYDEFAANRIIRREVVETV